MSVNEVSAELGSSPMTIREWLGAIARLFKLRVVMLLVWASLGGAFLGAGGLPDLATLGMLVLTGLLAAGGASAINQYLEYEIDTRMQRTQNRPLATGRIERSPALLLIAVAMIFASVLMVLPTRPVMALYLALGALVYVGIYTIWLKPRSITNVVIGSAAGSCAVLTGGAAVGAAADPGVITLAALLFLWSPTHFWALALYYKDDYTRAEFPMLPNFTTERGAAWWIFLHAAPTGLAALLLALHPMLGLPYLIPAAAITAALIAGSIGLIRTPERKRAIRLFVTSNLFLLLILLAILLVTSGRHLFG